MTQSTWARFGNAIRNAWRPDSQVQAQSTELSTTELAALLGSGMASSAGPSVSADSAMRVSAVYACVALVAGAISTLPLRVYARTKSGREPVEHDYWWLLNEEPNPETSAADFWEYLISSRLFYGDGFAEILRPSKYSNRVIGFMQHHPLRVAPFRDSNGRLFYRITPIVGEQYVLDPADIVHIKSLGFDRSTMRSPSPITLAAKQHVGTSLAAAEYNARFFSNGARPDFALKAPGSLSQDQAQMIRSTWGERHAGVANSHLPAVLTGGMEIQQLSLSAQDSQILATSQFALEEIARILGVPPHMIGHTDKTTSWGSGVENMGRGFAKFTLKRDLKKIQDEFNRRLWPSREKYFVEFDLADIERGDLKSENEAFRIALGRAGEPGWLTQNEVRKAKLLPPKEGGDELLEVVAPAEPAAPETDAPPTDTGAK